MTDSSALDRRYRRLLVTYPRAYRRERGTEIVHTMADAAPPGRVRPTVREAVNLVTSGLRCRLGRPGSRVVVVLSLLTALLAGFVGAAGSSRLAWETAAPLPSDGSALATFRTAVPDGPRHVDRQRDRFLFGYTWERSWWEGAKEAAGMAGFDDYGPGALGMSADQPRHGPAHRYAATAAARLRADGWHVSPESYACQGSPCPAAGFTEFNARKGATVLRYSATVGQPTSDGFLDEPGGHWLTTGIALYRARPALVPPAEIVGGLLAAALAWLLFAWVSRRTWRRHPLVQLPVYLLYATFLVLWAIPVLALAAFTELSHGNPMPNNWGTPTSELFMALIFPGTWPTLLGLVAGALLVGLAAVVRDGPPRVAAEA
ncbi:MAG TPA: hypothetical protein VGN37_10845 [Actinocatenispora sp.]